MIIDSHCHLNYEPIFSSLKEYIGRANKEGVDYMLTISTDDKDFQKIIYIVDQYKCIFGTYGIHPHEASSHKHIKSKNILENIKKNKKIIGIGETGLDFFYNHSKKNEQIDLFLEHIEAAQKAEIPLIIHTRSAEKETLDLLKDATKKKDTKILIHCFSGTEEFAFKLLDLGCYISASGIVTFKNSKELANTFVKIPNEKILVETDSPYLAPVPLRGKKNEPSFIKHTVKHLAFLKNIKAEDFASLTTENFFNLFGNLNGK